MADSSVRPGLEGVLAAETRLSAIDGEAGELVIAGFPLAEFATHARFEETLFALFEDRLPTADELEAFSAELRANRTLATGTRTVVERAAEDGQSAMDALRMGIASATLARDGDEDLTDDARLAVAQVPSIVATYWRVREGQPVLEPRRELSHAGNYLYMLTGEEPSDEAVRGLETYLNTVVDHGLNASTFTARAIVSTESDVVSAVTGAVGALKGPLHGGAPGPVLDLLEETAGADDTETHLREKLEAGERLMGFGHRVYRVRDPRAAVLSSAAERFYRDGDEETAFFESARETEAAALAALEEHRPDLELSTNVEFYTAVLLHGVGIPRDLFSATFAVSRVGGWCAHCLEQREENRLIRPRSRYVGERDRSWTPLEER
ncbi:citrate synthase [Natronobiforma cellulositropha]|uniref:citrate synthase n=1 Tax=Natronobiforma cellulositropha TaxID=1679076 RepID=UPI0021D583E1|nr:citrate synthase [Natronobiforma cellulositropha]